ncbi:gamma-glutamylcyclotransferase family protein [Thalassoglobus polymorphus]|uniref:Gamma-glutamylcyclotransferase family protein n=1 Tax=Thalassoglobus polymorphus TaxID=2527994 RepID=A0A517QV42_9PLAN|nr:gamma-glutamylcyclotransferase family protein [Thalassoglobus polymorphus]QDT35509.1 Gamma-glutamylcyclotransferase family protein YtfP [Thalassoglobus polymorphus]
MDVEEELITIFVYGTLKRGDCRHHVVSRFHFLGEAVTQPVYRLFHLGSYPGLVEVAEDGSEVQGELYAIDPERIREVDEIEGVEAGLYQRVPVQLQSPWRISGAETYLYLGDVSHAKDLGTHWEVAES